MRPLKLEGDTLGDKHRHFNKLVEDAITDSNYELRKISSDDSDVDSLLKIAIASKTRNVDYIIEVMKSNDILYAATAIKKSTWLITEPQYAHIINPEYLHTQLLPSMNTNTFNRLMLHIRLNLKNESRVETFYDYLKGSNHSYKWLQNCSIPFIQNAIKNERLIPLPLFKRLCKKSVAILSHHSRVETHSKKHLKSEIMFLLKSHTTEVLDVLEDKEYDEFPELGKRKTKILMKTCLQRVLDNFEKYVDIIDLSVVAKYLNKKEIKAFLYKQARTLGPRLYDYNTLRSFIKNMPEHERFKFAKKTFIDKTEMTLLFTEEGSRIIESKIKPYQWFEFASFNVAFPELKNLIVFENSPSERCAMLLVLITCARKNLQHIKTLLKYVYEKHITEPLTFKIQFVNNLLSRISTHEFDVDTWNVLDQMFHNMEVYTESNNVQKCLESIVLYKVLQKEPVPELFEQQLSCHSFRKVQSKLNEEQRSNMFTYLFNTVLTKFQLETIANETDFSETLDLLKHTLTLLRDWGKDISNYPGILEKIREMIKLKQENMWKTDMSCLYIVNKSWRKHMFEESLSLCLSEEVCLNALKHNPQLLTRHDKEIDTLRTNDAVSLRRLLAKLRVYWRDSLAQHWTDAYLLHLKKPTGQRAVVRGLFTLLSQNQVIVMAKKYVPADYKIILGETDQADISIQRTIAQNLYIARPLIPLDTILWYAKGDYLQYALPSLISVLSKLSETGSSRNNLTRKFLGRIGFSKLKPDKRKSLILNIWNNTTNNIIRSGIFRYTFFLMCRVKKLTVEKELFKLLKMFFDQLPPHAPVEIIKLLARRMDRVPISVRAEFFMKSYEYLASLPDRVRTNDINNRMRNLADYARWKPDLIQSFDDDFVIHKLLSPAQTKFQWNYYYHEIFAYYILYANTEEDQLQRFRKLVLPLLEEAFTSWCKGVVEYHNKIKAVIEFFDQLMEMYREFVLTRRTTPAKLFTEIKTVMDNKMQVLENYALYTTWKLATEYAILMQQYIFIIGNELWTGDNENIWNEIHDAMIPELSSIIVNCLKEDTEKYFPSICLLYADGLFYFNSIHGSDFVLHILKHMLNADSNNNNYAPSYIIASRWIADNFNNIGNNPVQRVQAQEVLNIIESNPSEEVQIHYRNDFNDIVTDE